MPLAANAPQPTVLPPTKYSVENCTDISIYCPVQFTIYGYYPSLGANAFFCAVFGICCIIQLAAGIKYKTWTYLIALFWGCLGEALGYVGRIMLHSNPWDSIGFDIQICCIIIAPAFLAAGIYLTLKHVVLEIGNDFSRIRAKYYTWIFILCDLFSLVLQGSGGGIAATANHGSTMQKTGNNLMMAGIVWQVFTLIVFGILVADYVVRARANRTRFEPAAIKLLSNQRFKLFVAGLCLAYITIFTRCVFRIGEMAKGWGNPIMQSQPDFIALDSVMIMIATICLTAFHPGWMFKEMQMHGKTNPISEFQTANAEKVADMNSASPSGSLEEAGRPKKKGFFRRS